MSSIRDRVAATASVYERVHVPGWDVDVEVRPITVKTRAELLKAAAVDDALDMGLFGPFLVVASVYDPDSGEPAFTAEDVEMLTEQAAGPIDHLVQVAMRVSGLGPDAVELGKDGS